MGSNRVTDLMPRHLRRWIIFTQRLPTLLMILFTLAVTADRTASVGTMMLLSRWGVSKLEFGVVCAMATVYMMVATRKLTWQSAIHFGLGTLPFLFFTLLTIFRVLVEGLPITAAVVYLFGYGALILLYWLAVALAEWDSKVNHAERGDR